MFAEGISIKLAHHDLCDKVRSVVHGVHSSSQFVMQNNACLERSGL